MSLEMKLTYDDRENTKQLFSEFLALLLDQDENFRKYMALQNYDDELNSLREKYGPPMGRFYIAYWDGQAAGCIAFTQSSETECEMKRLYVKPAFRGRGIGKKLVEQILRDAREIGYQAMVLETIPAFKEAIRIYQDLGFFKIPKFRDGPLSYTIFMKLNLQQGGKTDVSGD